MSSDKKKRNDLGNAGQEDLIGTLQDENARLTAALKFYADGRNWSDRRTLKAYLRQPSDKKECFYFSNALRALLGHGCAVARDALMETNSELWRIHGDPALEKAWNEVAKKYQKIAEENRELRKLLRMRCRYCEGGEQTDSYCIYCAPRASDRVKRGT